MPNPTLERAGRLADLDGDGPFALSVGEVELVAVRDGGELRVFEGRCPHRGALLGEGELDGRSLVCRNHRWRFAVDSGRREDGPGCLRACPSKVEAGELLVDVSALRRTSGVGADARRIADLPGPPRLPLIGSAHLLEPSRLHLVLEGWAREHGTPYAYGMGPRDVVVFGDMDDTLPALRDRPERFRRVATLAPILDELGVGGVFSAEGAAWRPQRRLSMEALSHRHLRSFYPTLGAVAERLRRRWLGHAERGETLDLAEELKRFTVDVTTQLVFGVDLDTLGAGDAVLQEQLGVLFPALNERLFSVIPWWRYLPRPRDREVQRALDEVKAWLGGLVDEGRARLAEDPSRAAHPAHFLEAMLVARDEEGAPYDDEAIIGNALTMLLAGEDTTAYSLAWAVHHLLEAPEEVARLRSELVGALGSAPIPPTIEVATGLAYAGAVANEAMRLRPVAPVLFLEPTIDTELGGVFLPKGTPTVCLLRAPAMRPESFGAPEIFRPARWVDPSATGGAHDPGAHQPFGSGPRICPGRTLALLEMKLVLATLYQNFDVRRVGRARDVSERMAFTMTPVGLRVRLDRRSLVGRTR